MSVEALYLAHRDHLWGVCYRMTGCAADADDLVQTTFARAMERPPRDTSRPWRPWLVKVAVNLTRDHLRRRRRQPYTGPWLPAPVELAPGAFEAGAEGRYGMLESASFAFLMAAEALTPQQRAVLLLRDVFDYTGQEAAEALGCSPGAVRTALHRARRAMSLYDTARCPPDGAHQARTLRTMEQFIEKMIQGDVKGVECLLAESVTALSDSNGAYLSARNPILGARRVAAFYCGLSRRNQKNPGPITSSVRTLNGLPALVVHWADPEPRLAPCVAMIFIIDAQGLVQGLHTVVAPRKLTRLLAQHAG